MSNRIIIFIALCVLIPFMDCNAQIYDTIFERSFHKCYSNDDKSKKDEMVYFEAVKLDGKMVFSVIKGTHSKFIYDRIYKTLDCIDPATITKDTVKYIHYNRELDYEDFENHKRVTEERISKFKQLHDIDNDVGVIVVSNFPTLR